MEKEYYDAQIKYINEIRSIRHDIQAHMIVLQYYLESENYEKAKAYLGDMKKHQDRQGLIFQDTGHDLVNAIVSDILGKSEKKIEFQLDGILPEKFGMSEYDMCTLFSNLFSNAMEACERLQNSNPVISMKIYEENQKCFITLQNPIEWTIEMDGTRFVTSKMDKDSHGYGTKNILNVVKQYNGKVDYLVTDKTFQVEIMLENLR